MARALKKHVSKQEYTSQKQLEIPGFETPFVQHLDPTNRWVILARSIPWDSLVSVYQNQMDNSDTGASGLNPRVALGAVIIKHMCDYSDRETILQIQENIYMQYFIGYSSFSKEEAFDASLFVEIRKRLGADQVNQINEKIQQLSEGGLIGREPSVTDKTLDENSNKTEPVIVEKNQIISPQEEQRENHQCDNKTEQEIEDKHEGQLIVDATACPQDIRYPTDLDLLNDAREKSEELIDCLFCPGIHLSKPRTYRKEARKYYLKTAQKKNKKKKEIREAVRRQLNYLKRNINNILKLLEAYEQTPLDCHQDEYLSVIQTLYNQQAEMYAEKKNTVEHRIVSIHQPHVRPIVRGKANARVEFGAKIHVSLMNGFAFLEDFSWEAFNEGTRLMDAIERYKKRFGYYPKEVLADKIYCTRENRRKLKLLGIALRAKPLGRPKAVEAHVRPGERNPIEGKFGQAKAGYGMNRIKARLSSTSESWIASIIMVLNLVKLAGQVPFSLIQKIFTISARRFKYMNAGLAGTIT
jgi:hypothetical protein